MRYTALDLASSFLGVHEVSGAMSEPLIVAMLASCNYDIADDEVAWCSAFVNFIAKRFSFMPKTNSLRARSWLRAGVPVTLADAKSGWDVVVFKRGEGEQPGPEVIDAPGHVAFFITYDTALQVVKVLGGNQGNSVKIATYPVRQILGIRRLYQE